MGYVHGRSLDQQVFRNLPLRSKGRAMTRVYCTYFDHRYLAKGLALIRSLRRHVPDAQVWVLCLSSQVEQILSETAEPGVTSIALADLEHGDAELAAAKADGRGAVEYYFTLTPSLVRYVMNHAEAEIVTYLDGDMWFLADPEPVYREMGSASILIIPHGFAAAMKHMERFGIYNVGWLSFRDDERGRACLEWWRTRTNEWCFERLEDGRYCDQKYLDEFPKLFKGVHILSNLGANLAPWNVAATTLAQHGGRLFAGPDAVIFFHFHGLKELKDNLYLTAHGFYRAPLTALLRDSLYRPYLNEVLAIEREMRSRFAYAERDSLRELYGNRKTLFAHVRQIVKMWINQWRGYTIDLNRSA
jgi:hypothetical protein